MKTITKALATLAAVPLVLAASAPGVASTAQNFHGVYDGSIVREGCTVTPPGPETTSATGNWNVRITGDKVAASTNLFYDDLHHLAWGGTGFTLLSDEGDSGFSFQADLADGATLTMTLDEDGNLTYVVAPYNLFGYECDSLTLSGHTN